MNLKIEYTITDDLIQARRGAASNKSSTKSTTTPRNNRRKSLKSTTGSASKVASKNNDPSKKMSKALGTTRAKRNAKTAARRGLSNNTKADPKSIEREVYRLQRTSGSANGVGSRTRSNGQPRRSNRIRNNNNTSNNRNNNKENTRSVADRKIKAKNLKNQKNNNHGNVLKPPTKKAFSAAVKAMTSAGFKAPQGMKMVISFAPTENNNNTKNKNTNNNSRNNNNRRGQNPRGRR